MNRETMPPLLQSLVVDVHFSSDVVVVCCDLRHRLSLFICRRRYRGRRRSLSLFICHRLLSLVVIVVVVLRRGLCFG